MSQFTPLTIGTLLNNRYRIVKLLGQGGFGAVYRAWDTVLNIPVGLKENFAVSTASQSQFLREASLLAKLNHPNLPRVTDHFVIAGQGQYLVMDYIEGEDIQGILKRTSSALPETQVLDWINQICDALVYLHSQNPPVIHRDIKPGNIRITPQGRAMLVDFGIAKEYDPLLKTTAGAQAVTPGYSPPEQYGQGLTDTRTDIYALGATMYRALTNYEPVESVHRTIGKPLPAPRSLNPAITPQIEALILKAMEISPETRYQSIAEMRRALFNRPAPSLQAPVVQVGKASSVNPAIEYFSPGAPQFPIAPQLPVAPQSPAMPTLAPPQVLPLHKNKNVWIALAGGVALIVVFALLYGQGSFTHNTTPTKVVRTAVHASLTPLLPSITALLPSKTVLLPSLTVMPSSTSGSQATLTVVPSQVVELTNTLPAPSATQANQSHRNPRDKATLLMIPQGEFIMGLTQGQVNNLTRTFSDCDGNLFQASKPAHRVSLNAFWIYSTEVTNGMYAQCVADGVCSPPSDVGSSTRKYYYGNAQYKNYPVVNVTWFSAEQYCSWAGGRLPTEAEWEKAGRGTSGWLFPWGNTPPSSQLANFGQMVGDTTAVGSYPQGASPYGVLDMAGNVWEWVADWYEQDYYTVSPADNPTGPSKSSTGTRVGRGGSWFWGGCYASVAYHDSWEPDKIDTGVGFRCVIDNTP
jgi:eukaryotic-like serine/threonine-protein kinase